MAHRGNFDVVPSRLRSAMSSSLTTTPSVSNASARRAGRSFLAPLAAVLRYLVDAFQRLPMRLDRQPPLLERFEKLAMCVRRTVRADELIQKRAQPAFPHLFRDRSDESRRTRRCEGSQTAARPLLRAPCSCARTLCAEDRSRRGFRWCPSVRPRACEECP